MKLLIDTHVLIWWLSDPERLSYDATTLLRERDNEIMVSAVSGYEIEFKRPLDPMLQSLPWNLEAAVTRQDFVWRPIRPADAMTAGRLPRHHRDPWDRLLIAQALEDGAPLLSVDRHFAAYGVQVIW